ncbi:hypothetical protein EIK77_001106 [Talaromyces pinophilus]|nr:hypothetical protein EIK77_001106 [Talaromyces pinophilus]
MLEPIEENGDAFSGPIQRGNVPYDTSAIQEKWFMQARGCAQACGDTDTSRLEKQKAYFALGMLVFGLQQKPWTQDLWGNRILDIWYDMGFAVVYRTEGSKDLQDMCECFFRKDFGVPSRSFEKFYDYWTKGTFAQSFKLWIKTDETYDRRFSPWISSREFENLKGFLEARANKRAESVWRLWHLLAVETRKKTSWGPERNYSRPG